MKVKSDSSVRDKAIYLAFVVNLQGLKEVLGIWASDNEGSRVLDAGHYRAEDVRCAGYFHRLCRWLERFPEAIDTSDSSANLDSALHRASCPALALLRLAQRP